MGDTISNIHSKWWGNYSLLERHHGWVQWLYPNHYESRFNNNSQALTQEEAKIFRDRIDIAKKLIKSYKMFLEFLGIDFEVFPDGQVHIQRSENYKERYQATFISSWHNHMRVTRLLAHFNVTGFRQIAIHLVSFLEKEIYGDTGYTPNLEGLRLTRGREKDQQAPLNSISHSRAFQEWVQYAKCRTKKEYDNLISMCLTTMEVLEEKSIYFRQNNQNESQ